MYSWNSGILKEHPPRETGEGKKKNLKRFHIIDERQEIIGMYGGIYRGPEGQRSPDLPDYSL